MKCLDIEQIYNLYVATSGVCTDTRSIEKDCMFFALRGETFNGNDFACDAVKAGARYAVVDDPSVEQANEDACILVESVLVCLQQIARYHRLKFKIPVIGLTGTNGKTTTKELITAALEAKYNVVSTKGNLNNHIGVPLTLLRINSTTQVAVVEMGASNPGEITTLVKLVCPSFGLITNVGKAHLLGFGSFEGVKKTKGELYDNLEEYRKIAFVNVDNPNLVEMAAQRPSMQIVPYGIKNDNAQIIDNKDGNPFLTLSIPNPCYMAVNEGEPANIVIPTHLIGSYNVENVLAALCISSYLDVATKDAVRAISNYIPSNNRSQMTKTQKNTLIIDAYNANPTSMRASLENFGNYSSKHKVLLLGDMLELGADSIEEHKQILKLAAGINPDKIFLVGGEFHTAYEQLSAAGELSGREIYLFEDSLLLDKWLASNSLEGYAILVKGSRGKKLERALGNL